MSTLAAGPEHDAPKVVDVLIGELASHGYRVAPPQTLNAAAFGIPQDRRRVFLIGTRDDCRPRATPRQKQHRKAGARSEQAANSSPVPGRPLCPTVAEAIADLPDLDAFTALHFADEVALSAARIRKMHAAASPYARHLLGLDHDDTDYSYPRIWDEASLTSSHRTIHAGAVTTRFALTTPGCYRADQPIVSPSLSRRELHATRRHPLRTRRLRCAPADTPPPSTRNLRQRGGAAALLPRLVQVALDKVARFPRGRQRTLPAARPRSRS